MWENDIKKVSSTRCYKIIKLAVKDYNNSKYLTFTRRTTLEPVELSIEREDELNVKAEQLKVQSPPQGVNFVEHFLTCKKCHSKVVDNATKIVKCTECGLTQLNAKCETEVVASVMSVNDEEQMNLTILDGVTEQLYKIYKEHNPGLEAYKELTDDDIIEMLLMVDATVLFNDKKNGIKVVVS